MTVLALLLTAVLPAAAVAENNWSSLGDFAKKDSLIDRVKKIFINYKRIFTLLWSMLRG